MTAFNPFDGAPPRWWSIPAHRPFLEDLAAGVLAWLGDAPPEALSDAVILLPNRRAARSFTAALARQSGGRPILLPQVRPLGDLEEDEPPFAPGELGLDLPPAIAPLTRRFEMARMIVEDFGFAHGPLRALEMADALGAFLDSCQLEEIEDLTTLQGLVEGELAKHWQEAARFLKLAVEAWPQRLAALGLVDPAWRRAKMLRMLAQSWEANPPQGPVIAAGSTGTAPAAADVLKWVGRAPMGCVVVPGLASVAEVDDAVWTSLLKEKNEPHPQSALRRLLHRCDVPREAVRPWFTPPVEHEAATRDAARSRLLFEALRPPDATADWRTAIADLRASGGPDPIAEGLKGLQVVSVRAEEDAAQTIALMMRETLETPTRTCALVTPDQALGRRVAARLERWGIVPDESSGAPLTRFPVGDLIDLAARFLADPMEPQIQLALVKHPLVRFDLAPVETGAAVAALEERGLRGPRQRDFARLRARILDPGTRPLDDDAARERFRLKAEAALALLDRLEALAAAGRSAFGETATPDVAARAVTELVEALAGPEAWGGREGEAAAALMAALLEGGRALGHLDRDDFARLIRALMAETTVRTGGATHPRLRILGAIEARLVRADRMILAGLEEGVWPGAAPTDPFLSRPMRAALGLPPPERRVGQTAQDFVQAACCRDAVLVHCERRGGQPAVKSRWLWRLDMLVKGASTRAAPLKLEGPAPLRDAARALDRPDRVSPAPRPRPRPPVDRRPRKLPVTAVERWVRDPYAVYARYVLGLRQLDRPGQPNEAIARGQAVHKAMERLTQDWPHALPDDAAETLTRLLFTAMDEEGFHGPVMARESPLVRRSARWLADFETRRRARGVDLHAEVSMTLPVAAPFAPFTLTAKADRIEMSGTGVAVLDFKTGQIPSAKQMKAGFAPQLTLTAAILADKGAPDLTAAPPEELTYVRVVGRKVPGVEKTLAFGAEAGDLAEAALEGLKRTIARFDDEGTPYLSWVAPQFMGNFGGNYDHLSRVFEWHVVGVEDGGGAE